MSLKFRNEQGIETPISGLNGTSGELVASVTYMQSGTATFSEIEVNAVGSCEVTLPTPMPDTNYLVQVYSDNTASSDHRFTWFVRINSASKFTIYATNVYSTSLTPEAVKWTAFKPITDEQVRLDEGTIQQNATDIAAINNKLVPRTTINSSSDLNDFNTEGFYSFGAVNIANGPITYAGGGCYLDIKTYNGNVTQIFYRWNYSNPYIRVGYSDNGVLNWGNWQQLATTDDFSGVFINITSVSGFTIAANIDSRSFVRQLHIGDVVKCHAANGISLSSEGWYEVSGLTDLGITNIQSLVSGVDNATELTFVVKKSLTVLYLDLVSVDATSTVTENSTAPVTSGGVYNALNNGNNGIWHTAGYAYSNQCTFGLENGLYLLSVDAHGYDESKALYFVSLFSNQGTPTITPTKIVSTYSSDPTFGRDADGNVIVNTPSNVNRCFVNYQYIGAYF